MNTDYMKPDCALKGFRKKNRLDSYYYRVLKLVLLHVEI